jgi:hypothetical protein
MSLQEIFVFRNEVNDDCPRMVTSRLEQCVDLVSQDVH